MVLRLWSSPLIQMKGRRGANFFENPPFTRYFGWILYYPYSETKKGKAGYSGKDAAFGRSTQRLDLAKNMRHKNKARDDALM
jgi:hypothetical protein